MSGMRLAGCARLLVPAALGVLGWSSPAWAQANTTSSTVGLTSPTQPLQNNYTTIIVVQRAEHLKVGGQQYYASPGGFRRYLEDIRLEAPELYAALDPDVSELESRTTTSNILVWGGSAAALAIMAAGYFGYPALHPCADWLPRDERRACREHNETAMVTIMVTGAVLGFGAAIYGEIIKPRRSDLLETVRKHNRLAPPDPMEISFGYDPHRGLATGHLRLSF